MTTNTTTERRSDLSATHGIDPDDREQLLLDDLRVEVKHLREAIERQNELLAQIDAVDAEGRA
jgi:Mg2+ and Co2+ transporter CorA